MALHKVYSGAPNLSIRLMWMSIDVFLFYLLFYFFLQKFLLQQHVINSNRNLAWEPEGQVPETNHM